MSTSLKEVEEQARQLSADERAAPAQSMLESLQESTAEIETAWAREIDRRTAAYDRGESKSHTAEDVFAEARQLSR